MSFAYAEKNDDPIAGGERPAIYCDTKITLGDYSGAHFPGSTRELINKWGIIKSTICNPNLCITFAGNNIMYAAQLFQKLSEKPFEYSDVVKYALEIHKRAGDVNDIEFLITYHDDNRFQIDCVKDGEAFIDCKTAWIGSPEAHEAFQRYRSMCNPGTERASRYTTSAFADVVAGCKDTSVGGFPIKVHYSDEKNEFCYSNRYTFFDSKSQLVKAGETIQFHMSARDGGYSYEIISDSLFAVLISIDQLDHMILYSRNLRSAPISANDPCLFGLMLPMRVITNDNGELVNIG